MIMTCTTVCNLLYWPPHTWSTGRSMFMTTTLCNLLYWPPYTWSILGVHDCDHPLQPHILTYHTWSTRDQCSWHWPPTFVTSYIDLLIPDLIEDQWSWPVPPFATSYIDLLIPDLLEVWWSWRPFAASCWPPTSSLRPQFLLGTFPWCW